MTYAVFSNYFQNWRMLKQCSKKKITPKIKFRLLDIDYENRNT